jgi:hypothetical protein
MRTTELRRTPAILTRMTESGLEVGTCSTAEQYQDEKKLMIASG